MYLISNIDSIKINILGWLNFHIVKINNFILYKSSNPTSYYKINKKQFTPGTNQISTHQPQLASTTNCTFGSTHFFKKILALLDLFFSINSINKLNYKAYQIAFSDLLFLTLNYSKPSKVLLALFPKKIQKFKYRYLFQYNNHYYRYIHPKKQYSSPLILSNYPNRGFCCFQPNSKKA